VIAACFCAACAQPRDRQAATSVMNGLSVTWALYLLAWTEVPPASLFWMIGIPLTSEHLWALTDAVLATVVIAAAWHRWWGWVIFGALTVQQCFHAAYDLGGMTFPQLSIALDLSFLVQLACFFVIGGSGVVDRVARLARVRRGFLHSPRTALRTKE
jgi:hypothetical protein